MTTASQEDYLSTIYRLQGDDGDGDHGDDADLGVATTGRIADALDVSQASVTAFLKRAAEEGLVEHRSHKGARLTEAGRREALKVIRRHRVVERFLVDVLGIPWDRVDGEAHRLEHAVSDLVISRMEALLEDPEHCPHGFPIPDAGLAVADEPGRPLSSFEPGEAVRVVRVDEDPELLRYLDELGLVPGAVVEVVDRHPFDGPLVVRIDGVEETLGLRAANRVVAAPRQEVSA